MSSCRRIKVPGVISGGSGVQTAGPTAISFNSTLNPCSAEPPLQRDWGREGEEGGGQNK